MNIMETGRQTASMTAWEAISAPEQVEIIIKAAKRAVYIAGAYGVVLTVDEILGATWEGTVKRLEGGRLDKANAKRTAEGKEALTIMQIAHRAAHGAAELYRYDLDKHSALPLEFWEAVDDGNMEDQIIDRLAIADYVKQLDSRGQSIMELTAQGYTERETGKAVGISGGAVHKRVTRMRQSLRKAIA